MPAQQHAHSLSTTLSTAKAPTTNLCETALLRRRILSSRKPRLRLSLAHALVDVLHESVADL